MFRRTLHTNQLLLPALSRSYLLIPVYDPSWRQCRCFYLAVSSWHPVTVFVARQGLLLPPKWGSSAVFERRDKYSWNNVVWVFSKAIEITFLLDNFSSLLWDYITFDGIIRNCLFLIFILFQKRMSNFFCKSVICKRESPRPPGLIKWIPLYSGAPKLILQPYTVRCTHDWFSPLWVFLFRFCCSQ